MSESSGSMQPTPPSASLSLAQTVRRMFVKWLLFSIAAIFAVALISGARATAADVFVDEGDSDFDKPTPVETPATASGSGAGLDPDTDFSAAKASESGDAMTGDASAPVIDTADSTTDAAPQVEPAKPVVETKKVEKKKSVATKSKAPVKSKVATKVSKKKTTKVTAKTKTAKKSAAIGKSKKKSTAEKKTSKRKVASATKFAGGQYVTTSRECAMESAPGAGDSVGTTKAERKLWVEDAGDGGYWKVYSKSGQAAFLSRSCF